jgi:hypothetical protein
MSHSDFLKFIQEERARELAFESHRKLDLIRWGILVSRLHSIGEQIAALPAQIPDPLDPSLTIPNPAVVQGGSGVQQNMTILSAVFAQVGDRHMLMPIPEIEVTTNREITANNPDW